MINDVVNPGPFRAAAVLSRGILRLPCLQDFLPECARLASPGQLRGRGFDVVIGWGHKETAMKARRLAEQQGTPYLALEDGFLRSVAPGVSGAPPLSIVVDDVGIYYDATLPSRLEQLLENGGWEAPELLERARSAISLIVAERLSKYNHAPLLDRPLPGQGKQKVLVIDQTWGDCSVTYGLADAATFTRMLTAALEENPAADIIVKTHPDVLAGKKRGYLTPSKNSDARVQLLAEEVNPLSLIEKCDRIYTVTSQMGFEALLLGKVVECFGVPFYAGWGLTRDRQTVPRRTRIRTLEELFAAAFLLYPRYLNPFTRTAGSLEDVLDYLSLQVQHQRSLTGQKLLCSGFHWWKRRYIPKVLRAPGSRVEFGSSFRALAKSDRVVVWGDGRRSSLASEAEKRGIPVLHMEDGFLRSVGLGSNLVRPLSLVFDSCGIYFDPTRPSDLETMLRETVFTAALRRRAVALSRRIVSERFSKYNVGEDTALAINNKRAGQVVVLVPGQVEDDASIRLGCVDIRTNVDLLMAVRRHCPDAYIIFKPHPDVLAGNRKGNVPENVARQYCDQVVTDRSMPACLDIAHEVHTLTSLTGFEALLHGKKVVCYGLPFYAGWGLTQDKHALPRRGRSLAIEELVAGALILYPRYIDWQRGEIIPVEVALNRLGEKKLSSPGCRYVKKSMIGQCVTRLSGFFDAIR